MGRPILSPGKKVTGEKTDRYTGSGPTERWAFMKFQKPHFFGTDRQKNEWASPRHYAPAIFSKLGAKIICRQQKNHEKLPSMQRVHETLQTPKLITIIILNCHLANIFVKMTSAYYLLHTGINRLFAYCKGGNFSIHTWA